MKLGKTLVGRIIIVPLLLSFSCDFEPDQEFFKHIPEPDLTGVTVNLDNQTSDTVFLFTNSRLRFSGIIGNRKMNNFKAYLNDQPVASGVAGQGNTGEFTLNAQALSEGAYLLRLEVYCSAGTGSIADVAGVELLQITRTWVAFVDRTPPEPLPVSVSIVDEMLQVSWPKHPRFNFQKYILTKAYNVGGTSYYGCWKKEIIDRNRNFFRDSTYVGGKVRYTLQVQAADQLSGASHKEFTLDYDPKFGFSWIDKNEVRLSWTKHPLKSLRHYQLTVSNTSSYSKTDASDTTFVFQPGLLFGDRRSAILEIVPYGEVCFSTLRADTHIQLGDTFAEFYGHSIVFNESLNRYFAIQKDNNWEDRLVRIGDSGVEQAYFLGNGQFAISPGGAFLYIAYDNVLKELDAMTFEVKRTLNLSDLTGEINRIWGRMTVSDNNVLTIVTTRGSFVLDEAFSIVRKTVSDPAISVSPSGNYLFSNDSVFQWNGSRFQGKETQKLPDVFHSIFQDDDKLILVYYETIGVFDLNTMSMENTTPFAGPVMSITFDRKSGFIGAFKQSYTDDIGTFYLFDRSANPITTFDIGNPDIHTSVYTLLINNHLICSQGTSLLLSHFYP